MFDAALIQQCADPTIEIAVVERFIAEAGSDNPLKVTITSGNRVILPQAPTNPDEAVQLIIRFVTQATVRVGITQYPAGYGISDATQISPEIVDACENIRMGTALFGKVYRVVSAAQGGSQEGTFNEAIAAWKTGAFENAYVFGMPDPGPLVESMSEEAGQFETPASPESAETLDHSGEGALEATATADPNQAGIRVDMSGYAPASE